MIADCRTIEDYIARYQVDGVMWKAKRLLGDVPATDVRRQDNVIKMANTLALIPHEVLRDDYAKKICKEYSLVYKTIEKLIADAQVIQRKKNDQRKAVRKNKISKLEGDPRKFPFFREIVKEDKDTGDLVLDRIKIDKYKFVHLLANFGFSRYEVSSNDNKDGFTFVQLRDNVISSVTREKIIDYIETFVKSEYNFEEAGYHHTDAETLINTFYDQIRTVFSKDLFARVRTEEKIIINQDTVDTTYLYYKNGFVEITKEGWKLRPYEDMSGSVWDHQMLERSFTYAEPEVEADENNDITDVNKAGYFADFCWKVSGQSTARFWSLCSIIGYLIHDFYETKLKAVLLTDSNLSDDSEGRTGKTLLGKMIGHVRSYCEINGKDFDAGNKNKYEDVRPGTQVVHINDVKHKGRFRFDFEDVFNDITEGFMVNAKYTTPFRQFSKMIISSNKALDIKGGSQRDRIIEFEMSDFFSETRSPQEYYGHWFGRDWNDDEWNRYDNFMCFCSQIFHTRGLVYPPAINLDERKLRHNTAPEFVEFMEDVIANIRDTGLPWQGYDGPTGKEFEKAQVHEFPFEKGRMHARFVHDYPDFKQLTIRSFVKWMKLFGLIRLGVKHPKEWKSNQSVFIQFINEE